jgi:nucleoside-diphosphate-sugar epimerase
MKLLLTGSTGFLGSYFEKYEKSKGADILCIVKSGRESSRTAISIDDSYFKEIIEDFAPEAVVDFATHFDLSPISRVNSNLINGTLDFHMTLANRLDYLNLPWIYTSSFWQKIRNCDNSYVSDYHFLKQVSVDFLESKKGIRLLEVVLMDTFGPGDKRNKIINLLMQATPDTEPLLLSKGFQYLNLLHIEDIADSLHKLLNKSLIDKGFKGTFNLISSEYLTLRNLVTKIESVRKIKLPIKWGAKPYRVGEIMKIPDFKRSDFFGNDKFTLEEALLRI